jgi:hypothetical protein
VRPCRSDLLCHGPAGAEKNRLKPWLKEQWCIPDPSPEFVARREDWLDPYEEPDDPTRPRVRCDERPCQWLADSRVPLAMPPGHPLRFDYAYTRHGTCNLCIMAEPFQGWRHVTVTTQRTTREFAQCMAELVHVHFPEAEKIRVVLDNLSPHTPGALYEVFPPAEARQILWPARWPLGKSGVIATTRRSSGALPLRMHGSS